METGIVVINSGSTSLKFAIYAGGSKRLELPYRGMIDSMQLGMLVFTAGIGENSASVRDLPRPGAERQEWADNLWNSCVSVLVIPTNEELMIAMQTQTLAATKMVLC